MTLSDQQDWRTTMLNHYMSDGVWHLSTEMDAFLVAHTDVSALAYENEYRRANGCAYTEENWRRDSYRQWYLAYYSSRYLSHVQRALLASWPSDRFDVGLTILDVGVGSGTTALAVMDLCNTAEQLGLLREGGHPRFIAIDRDEEKLDYAYETAFAFAESCATRLGERAWMKAFAAGSDWQPLDVGDLASVAAWPVGRRCEVVVLSNTYNELYKQGDARTVFTDSFLPRVLAPLYSVNALEPMLPHGGEQYKARLCRFASDAARVISPVKAVPCRGGTAADPAASACQSECRDTYRWRVPSVLEPFFGSKTWDEGSLRVMFRGRATPS